MSSGAQLDLEALRAYLGEQLPQIGRVERAEKFSDGQSNPTFALDTDRGRYVLRRKPPGELLKSAHAIEIRARTGPKGLTPMVQTAARFESWATLT